MRVRLSTDEDVSVNLARGEILRGGDLLATNDGRVVKVLARPEALLHVECDTPHALTRAAYHLGNRHVPTEVGEGYLRIAADHVLQRMLEGLGARVHHVTAAFEPEGGAYGTHSHSHGIGAHHHHAGERPAPARIHEYVALGPGRNER
jgi:urease accessory protein